MFGDKLRIARKSKGLTLERLALIYNSRFEGALSKGTLSKYENNKQEPMITVVGNLAQLLGVSVDYLIDDENLSADKKKIFSNQLKYYMKLFRMSYEDLANELFEDVSTISDWCEGLTFPTASDVWELAQLFKIPESELMDGPIKEIAGNTTPLLFERYNPKIHKIPVLGTIAAGLPLYAEQHIEDYTYTDRNHGAEYFALKVKGDSMNAASINEGSLLIVRRQENVENGEIAVVMVNNENATVKRFKKDGNIIQLIPQSYNPEHQIQIYDATQDKICIVGKVVECKMEF